MINNEKVDMNVEKKQKEDCQECEDEKSSIKDSLSNDRIVNGYTKMRSILPIPRRGSRKKTLSLNPEEREALENLIEEVIMDGGIADSDSGSSENEESPSKNSTSKTWSVGVDKYGKPVPKKYYPGQLKVALKHMSELPPRFSRKLKRAEKYLELNLAQKEAMATVSRIEEEDEEDSKEEKKVLANNLEKSKSYEIKRTIRNLLTDLDQYVDEKDRAGYNSAISQLPGAISCSEFEKEALSPSKEANNTVNDTSIGTYQQNIETMSYPILANSSPHFTYPSKSQLHLNKSDGTGYESNVHNLSEQTLQYNIPSTPYVSNLSNKFDLQQHLNLSSNQIAPQGFQREIFAVTGIGQTSLSATIPIMYPTMIMPSFGYQTNTMPPNNYVLSTPNIIPQHLMYPPPNFSMQNYLPSENPYIQFTQPPPPLPISVYNNSLSNYFNNKTTSENSQINLQQNQFETLKHESINNCNSKQKINSKSKNYNMCNLSQNKSIENNNSKLVLQQTETSTMLLENKQNINDKNLASTAKIQFHSKKSIYGDANNKNNFHSTVYSSKIGTLASTNSIFTVANTSTLPLDNRPLSSLKNYTTMNNSIKTVSKSSKAFKDSRSLLSTIINNPQSSRSRAITNTSIESIKNPGFESSSCLNQKEQSSQSFYPNNIVTSLNQVSNSSFKISALHEQRNSPLSLESNLFTNSNSNSNKLKFLNNSSVKGKDLLDKSICDINLFEETNVIPSCDTTGLCVTISKKFINKLNNIFSKTKGQDEDSEGNLTIHLDKVKLRILYETLFQTEDQNYKSTIKTSLKEE